MPTQKEILGQSQESYDNLLPPNHCPDCDFPLDDCICGEEEDLDEVA